MGITTWAPTMSAHCPNTGPKSYNLSMTKRADGPDVTALEVMGQRGPSDLVKDVRQLSAAIGCQCCHTPKTKIYIYIYNKLDCVLVVILDGCCESESVGVSDMTGA